MQIQYLSHCSSHHVFLTLSHSIGHGLFYYQAYLQLFFNCIQFHNFKVYNQHKKEIVFLKSIILSRYFLLIIVEETLLQINCQS